MTDNPFALDYAGPAPVDDEPVAIEKPAKAKRGPIYHPEFDQGSQQWLDARCGLLTASEMKKIVTPTLKVANNDETRKHVYELLFQRLTGFVEPSYISDAMLRGQEDEIYARDAYAKHFALVKEVGFVTNDEWGFTIGYSPDGVVGDDGLIEIKSRSGKYQVQTIAEDEVPAEYMIQLQTGLLVTGRKWIDFISYCGGMPMFVKRVEPDLLMQGAILAAAQAFELKLVEKERAYRATIAAMPVVVETERREEQEIEI